MASSALQQLKESGKSLAGESELCLALVPFPGAKEVFLDLKPPQNAQVQLLSLF